MSLQWSDAVVRHRKPLKPIDTAVASKLADLSALKAVIFDVYGTLVISGSGDVGTADETDRGSHLGEAIQAVGIQLAADRYPTIAELHRRIEETNRARHGEDCPKPEVDIVEIWRQTLTACGAVNLSPEQCCRVAAEYESRANPTWPMPMAKEVLVELKRRELRLGIVSNAQQFTLPLVEELAGRFGVDSVFDPNLCVFSFRYRQSKPGPRLFDVLCQGLQRLQIRPSEAIYVGNDRLNDVWAAERAGLRTAWFAGDQRSLRARESDPRISGLPHDVVLTRLDQLLECL
jgi:putative hydrolase of the HAD superfamily